MLSRLINREAKRYPNEQQGILDTLHAEAIENWTLTAGVVELSEDYKKRLLDGYGKDLRWKRYLDTLLSNEALEADATSLPFER